MKTLFHRAFKALAFLILAAGLPAQAEAQLVAYQFTGTKISGEEELGTTISGIVTLDVVAPFDYFGLINRSWDWRPYGYDEYGSHIGFYQFWRNGGFSVDAVTNSEFATGTFLGGDTYFVGFETDFKNHVWGTNYDRKESGSYISNWNYDRETATDRIVHIVGYNKALGTTVPRVVPNPWDPSANDVGEIQIAIFNNNTGAYQYGIFKIDTFTLFTTIIIDGIDTGIDDFQYQGKLVSKHLFKCAATANNHGDYINCVATLTNALMKAGQLTGKQKGIIMEAAVKSSYGK